MKGINYRKVLQMVSKMLFIAGSFFLLTWSCYYDSEEYLFPSVDSQCDTTNITYQHSVQPILSQRCYSCHSNTAYNIYGGNIKLEDYADVKLRVDDGRLIGSIKREAGFSPMPKGSSKLSDCNINTFDKWVAIGAPNN